jgi:hypothetical protein
LWSDLRSEALTDKRAPVPGSETELATQ